MRGALNEGGTLIFFFFFNIYIYFYSPLLDMGSVVLTLSGGRDTVFGDKVLFIFTVLLFSPLFLWVFSSYVFRLGYGQDPPPPPTPNGTKAKGRFKKVGLWGIMTLYPFYQV